MSNLINKDNFHYSTFVNFKKVYRKPNREPNYISKSGSKYWYTKQGVYRMSNHWGNVASCIWTINAKEMSARGIFYNMYFAQVHFKSGKDIGYAKWGDFSKMEIKEYLVSEINFDGWADDEYIEYINSLPTIKDGTYLAFEFNSLQIAKINDHTREISTPLMKHPNHKSKLVNIIHGLEFIDLTKLW